MLKLKEIRINKGKTQQELANFMGVHQMTISRFENEKRKLDQDSIVKLALYLEVTPDELLGFDDAYKEYTDYLIKLKEKENKD
ncbi:MAG: helix-turn-helix domain-containing protein [Firmicutes bacterium]|nr:helix-turn-helix domain-containing protein [Bacillota bacterium]